MIKVKKSDFIEGAYHILVDGFYIPFDTVVYSTSGMLSLRNDDRFVCVINYKNEAEVLKLMGEEGIEVLSEEALT